MRKSTNPTTRMALLQMIQPWSRLNIQYEDVIVNVDNRGTPYRDTLNPHYLYFFINETLHCDWSF